MSFRFAVLAAALAAGPAFAQEPVATATPPSVAEQIDAYLKASPVREIPTEGVDGVTPGGAGHDRRIHGEVSVGVGTGGYRSVYMRAEAPIGDSGNVSMAFQNTRGRVGHYGYLDGYGAGFGPGLGAPGEPGRLDRQRCDLEGLTPHRPLDVTGGPHGRCVGLPRR